MTEKPPITVTTAGHSFVTGDFVNVYGIHEPHGKGKPWRVTVLDAWTIELAPVRFAWLRVRLHGLRRGLHSLWLRARRR